MIHREMFVRISVFIYFINFRIAKQIQVAFCYWKLTDQFMVTKTCHLVYTIPLSLYLEKKTTLFSVCACA